MTEFGIPKKREELRGSRLQFKFQLGQNREAVGAVRISTPGGVNRRVTISTSSPSVELVLPKLRTFASSAV